MKFKNWTLQIAVLIAITGLISPSAYAQKIKVKKVKGQTALIETSIPLEEGQTYDLKEDVVSSNVNYSQYGFKSRKNSFTVGADLNIIRGDTLQENSFSVQGRYGWNFSHLEFGVVADVSYLDQGAGGLTNFAAGGYFDYNLVSNRDGRNLIYGPFGLLTIGALQQNNGSTNILDLNAGGFTTLFLGQSSTALRFEGFFDYRQVNASIGTTNLMGAGARALLVFYY